MSNPTLTPYRQSQDNQAAVLFIHGYSGHATETWGEFPNHFQQETALDGWDVYALGYPTSLIPDVWRGIWSADPGLETLADRLRTELNISPLAGYDRVVLITHSMGGLVAQKALLEAKVADQCHALFMFGTPSGGLRKAWLVRVLKRQFRDMSPGSDFISALRQDWDSAYSSDRPFHLVVAAGDRDEFVARSSSLDPFPENVQSVISGNHLSIVKPGSPNHSSVRLLVHTLTHDSLPSGPLESARLAVEQGEFQDAISQFQGVGDKLDDDALVQYAIALDKLDRRDESIKVLKERGRSGTDAMGTLAGRLKRRWKQQREKADAEEALDLYDDAYALAKKANDHAQAYYHAINVAFFQCCYKEDSSEAARWAIRALQHCEGDDSMGRRSRMWRAATRGEAQLLLGKENEALRAYQEAVEAQPEPWEALSMLEQAMDIADALYEEDTQDQIIDVFQESEHFKIDESGAL